MPMEISEGMAAIIRKQLDAEDDLVRASDVLDGIHLEIVQQAEIDGLWEREVEERVEQMRNTR